jgi:hypothetical protein
MTDIEELVCLENDWALKEFSDVNLGDKRLNKRLLKVTQDINSRPSNPINQCSDDWGSTKGAYRLFSNEKVTVEKIFSPHITNTQKRMQTYSRVLVVQDTTTINYTSHSALPELGNIGNDYTFGFMQHNALVLSPEGLPLGLIDQNCWSRPVTDESENKNNANRSIEEKESYRWIQSLQNTQLRSPIGVEAITICDRESDFYEFFDAAEKISAKYIIRMKNDRQLVNSDIKIKSFLREQPVIGTYSFDVPEKKGEYPARKATVEVRAGDVTIQPPRKLQSSVETSEILMHGIVVTEINPPENINPIEWFLVTNCVNEECDPMQIIDWYRLRWFVEIFHKVEKTNCKVEDCRLETKERMRRYLALNSIISWRILFMTYVARINPKAPAESILSKIELVALEHKYNLEKEREARTKNKSFKPKKIKNCRDAIRFIASLGGFLGRKYDNEPGIIAIARGLERLSDITDGVVIKILHAKKLMGNR